MLTFLSAGKLPSATLFLFVMNVNDLYRLIASATISHWLAAFASNVKLPGSRLNAVVVVEKLTGRGHGVPGFDRSPFENGGENG